MAFSFNIGSFLGGAAKAGSQRIDEVRKIAADKLVTDEERKWQIATEGRRDAAARKLQRDNKRASTDEYIASLTSLGYTADNAADIAAGGVANVTAWTDIGVKYKKTGKEWDINLLVNNKQTTDTNVVNDATNDVADPSEITTSQAAWMSLDEKPAPVFKELNDAFDYYQNKANNSFGTKKAEYQKQADDAMASLKAKAAELADDGKEEGSIFAKRNIDTFQKNNLLNSMEAVGQGINRTDERVIRNIGDEGRYNIGVLRAAVLDDATNVLPNGAGVANTALQTTVALTRQNAMAGLRKHAKRHITGQFEDSDSGNKSQYLKQEDVLTLIGSVSPEIPTLPDGTANTEYLSQGEVAKLYQTGRLDFGETYKYIIPGTSEGTPPRFVIGIFTGDIGRTTEVMKGNKKVVVPTTSYSFAENRILN
tara:strand:- start:2196 stop:3464 length:1269 start_codon:yes stop_codon:yes gene_type:complete